MDQLILLAVVIIVLTHFYNENQKEKAKYNKSKLEKEQFSLQKEKQKENENLQLAKKCSEVQSIEELGEIFASQGLHGIQLDIAIDYSKSNLMKGRTTFQRKNLHTISGRSDCVNPYQQVIKILGDVLRTEPFDNHKDIAIFGFGDKHSKENGRFISLTETKGCRTVDDLLQRYIEETPKITLSRPTNLAPIIREKMKTVEKSNDAFHLLLVISDGEIHDEQETVNALIEASQHPLHVVMVGVGDGPWDQMQKFVCPTPGRIFKNFHFVDFHECINEMKESEENLPRSTPPASPTPLRRQFNTSPASPTPSRRQFNNNNHNVSPESAALFAFRALNGILSHYLLFQRS